MGGGTVPTAASASSISCCRLAISCHCRDISRYLVRAHRFHLGDHGRPTLLAFCRVRNWYSSKVLQLGRLARHYVGVEAYDPERLARRRRPQLRSRKYFKTKPYSRPGKGPPQAHHGTSLSTVSGPASPLTTWYSAWQFRQVRQAMIRPLALSFLVDSVHSQTPCAMSHHCHTLPSQWTGPIVLVRGPSKALAIAGVFSFRAAYRQLEAPAAWRC